MKNFYDQNKGSDFESMGNLSSFGNNPIYTPGFLSAMDSNQLYEKRDPKVLKSTVIAINTGIRKPDSYNNRFPWYIACPSSGCYKKVEENATECHHCNNQFTNPIPRYLQSLTLQSRDGRMYADLFDDAFTKFINMDCSEFVSLYNLDEGAHKEFNLALKNKMYKPCVVAIKTYREEWDGVTRVKHNVMGTDVL